MVTVKLILCLAINATISQRYCFLAALLHQAEVCYCILPYVVPLTHLFSPGPQHMHICLIFQKSHFLRVQTMHGHNSLVPSDRFSCLLSKVATKQFWKLGKSFSSFVGYPHHVCHLTDKKYFLLFWSVITFVSKSDYLLIWYALPLIATGSWTT